MRRIDTIIVHCAAVPPDWRAGETVEAKRDEIDRWHRDRGWNGIGYHAVIDRDGSVAWGRPVEQAGAHVAGRNASTLGVCLLGGAGSDANDQFREHYTAEQERALSQIIADWKARFPTIKKVSGHNEYAAKACPGFQVQEWLAGRPRKITDSRTVRGAAIAGTSTAATAALDVVQGLQSDVAGLIQYTEALKWVFIGLAFVGAAISIYARVTDWQAGRR